MLSPSSPDTVSVDVIDQFRYSPTRRENDSRGGRYGRGTTTGTLRCTIRNPQIAMIASVAALASIASRSPSRSRSRSRSCRAFSAHDS